MVGKVFLLHEKKRNKRIPSPIQESCRNTMVLHYCK